VTCRRCIVSGRVQGVYFRGTTQQQARRLKLDGFARNLSDGTVEVVACGDRLQLDALQQWLWQGSEWSAVSGVVCSEVNVEVNSGFTTR
jgi:acylphosphatase